MEFVRGSDPNIANSNIGRIGGRQAITIGDNRDWSTIAHEIGHTVGLLHEQCRNDRDNYITIYWDNIASAYAHNYIKYSDRNIAGTDMGCFDYNSIMIYSSYNSSAINKQQPTMLTKNGGAIHPGNRLSEGDIEGARQIYRTSFLNYGSFLLPIVGETNVGVKQIYSSPSFLATRVWSIVSGKGDNVPFTFDSSGNVNVTYTKQGIYEVSCAYYGRDNIHVSTGWYEVLVYP